MFGGNAIACVLRAAGIAAGRAPEVVARDEDYWAEIRRAFDADRTLINLNHGGVCAAPAPVIEAMIRDIRFANAAPAHHLWDILEPRIEPVRRELAREFGCDPEELAITRNASEGMQTLISGVDLDPGDEVVTTNQNYGRMLTAWDQRARRDRIVVRRISIPTPPTPPDAIVARFRAALTPRTKVVEVTHVVNLTGQVMPVREIVDLGRDHGARVFVDGAHAFGQIAARRDDLGCDYYASSLHKWLLAPVGTGLLYVRRDKIPGIWPLMAAAPSRDADIRKFEEIGTHPAANHNAIAAALAFHRAIGTDRKHARLLYLRDRWADGLRAASSRVRLLSPAEPCQASALGLLHVEGVDHAKLRARLWDDYRIVTAAIDHAEFRGLRVTPNVDTSVQEIDTFVEAVIGAIAKLG